MIIVKIMGGLGNQLFQYALVEKLKSQGKKVKVDLSYFEDIPEGDTARDSIYEKLHGQYEIASMEDISALHKNTIWHKVRRRILRSTDEVYESEPSYKSDIITRNSGYLVGYWQSEKYFGDIREAILKSFDFAEAELVETKRNEESVSVHIRGGDYLTKAAKSYGGICTKEYYCKAIEYIAQKIQNPKFYIFTNDREYAKKIVDGVLESTGESISYQFVEGNDESHAYLDLVLMSKCKHHILANSSFSWWGEYLSDQSGITIAPSKWTNDNDNKDIYRNNWVVL